MVLWFIILGILIWIGLTVWAFLKDKMLGLVLFFSIPVVVIFILILIMIVIISLGKSVG